MLRAIQLGFRLSDLDQITIGELLDVLIENENDSYEYPIMATDDDFRSF
jgi:hypothetical protein